MWIQILIYFNYFSSLSDLSSDIICRSVVKILRTIADNGTDKRASVVRDESNARCDECAIVIVTNYSRSEFLPRYIARIISRCLILESVKTYCFFFFFNETSSFFFSLFLSHYRLVRRIVRVNFCVHSQIADAAIVTIMISCQLVTTRRLRVVCVQLTHWWQFVTAII